MSDENSPDNADNADIIRILLAQNGDLIAALRENSAINAIRAMNPPLVQPNAGTLVGGLDPYRDDVAPPALGGFDRKPPETFDDDPWGDPSVPLDLLRDPSRVWGDLDPTPAMPQMEPQVEGGDGALDPVEKFDAAVAPYIEEKIEADRGGQPRG